MKITYNVFNFAKGTVTTIERELPPVEEIMKHNVLFQMLCVSDGSPQGEDPKGLSAKHDSATGEAGDA